MVIQDIKMSLLDWALNSYIGTFGVVLWPLWINYLPFERMRLITFKSLITWYLKSSIFSGIYITTRTMKAILTDPLGDDLAFTNPREKKKSQIFYLSRVQIEDVTETIRAKDPIEMCPKKIRSECQEFYIGLNKSFRYASDLQYGMKKLESTSR